MGRRATGFRGCLQEAFKDGIQDVKRSVCVSLFLKGFFHRVIFFFVGERECGQLYIIPSNI